MVEARLQSAVSRPLHILLVEDHVDGRETLRRLLELVGHYVDVAPNGIEGVAKALAAHPEVAVVDIGLPRLDGYCVAQAVRAALGHSIFLIAYTAYGWPEDREKALESGFDVHLVKPVDWPELDHWLAVAADDTVP